MLIKLQFKIACLYSQFDSTDIFLLSYLWFNLILWSGSISPCSLLYPISCLFLISDVSLVWHPSWDMVTFYVSLKQKLEFTLGLLCVISCRYLKTYWLFHILDCEPPPPDPLIIRGTNSHCDIFMGYCILLLFWGNKNHASHGKITL